MTTPVLFLDFDGVVNFLGTEAAYRREPGSLGYVRRATLAVGELEFRVQWSAELVRELNSVKRSSPFQWLWLSTWREHAVVGIDPALGTRSDGFVPWGMPDDPSGDASAADRKGKRSTSKYGALLAEVRANPRPFVWVDDTATGAFNEFDFVGDLDVPHLVVAPRAEVGLLRWELEEIVAFLELGR